MPTTRLIEQERDRRRHGGRPTPVDGTQPLLLEDLVVERDVLGPVDQRGPARPVDAVPAVGADLGHRTPELERGSQRYGKARRAQGVGEADEVPVECALGGRHDGPG